MEFAVELKAKFSSGAKVVGTGQVRILWQSRWQWLTNPANNASHWLPLPTDFWLPVGAVIYGDGDGDAIGRRGVAGF
jgi:hypothetical protein